MTEPKHPKFEAFKAERLQNPAVREAYEASKASAPKHIPLTARLVTDFAAFVDERAHRLAETVAAAWDAIDAALIRVLQVPDDALVEFGDDPTEEEYR